jgi:hypothetical protein
MLIIWRSQNASVNSFKKRKFWVKSSFLSLLHILENMYRVNFEQDIQYPTSPRYGTYPVSGLTRYPAFGLAEYLYFFIVPNYKLTFSSNN